MNSNYSQLTPAQHEPAQLIDQGLIQTCSSESFQVVLPFGVVFGWYVAGDPRQ